MTEEILEKQSTSNLNKYAAEIAHIMSQVPNNPFIIDLLDRAFRISAEHSNEDDFKAKLAVATKIIPYALKTSQVNYFKYHLIIAVMLAGIDYEEYKVLDNSASTVKNITEGLTKFINADGAKAKWVAFYDVCTKDVDALVILLTAIVEKVKYLNKMEELTIVSQYELLVYGYLEASLRKSSIPLTNDIYPLYNEFIAEMGRAKF